MPDERTTIAYEILPAWTCPTCKAKNSVLRLPRDYTAAACRSCGTVTMVAYHGPPERPEPGQMLDAIAEVTGIPIDRILARSRYKEEVQARHLACFFLYRFCGLSLKDTGKQIDRDHSSVLHGLKKVERDIRVNPIWRDLVVKILNKVGVAPDPELIYKGTNGTVSSLRN